MKITRLETLRLGEFPNLVWLRLHTDEGVSGLGETAFAAAAVKAYLHEFVAPRAPGRDALEIEGPDAQPRGKPRENQGQTTFSVASREPRRKTWSVPDFLSPA